MGDIADLTLDQLFDEDYPEEDGPDFEPYDGFSNIMIDETTGASIGHGHKTKLTCKFCNKTNLWWDLYNNAWRLHDKSGPHICKKYKKETK